MSQANINSVRPKKLEFFIGGYSGPCYRVSLRGSEIVYSHSGYPEVALQPSIRKWLNFKKKIDNIGVWDWDEDYHNPNVLDGTQWELVIDYGDQKIKSYGSNLYPGTTILNWDKAPEFEALLHALGLLLGGVKIG